MTRRLLPALLLAALLAPAAAHAQVLIGPLGRTPAPLVAPRPPVPPPPPPTPRPPVPEPPAPTERPAVPCGGAHPCGQPDPDPAPPFTVAPAAAPGPAACVGSNPFGVVTVLLCVDRTTAPSGQQVTLTATIRVGGQPVPDGTSCFIWGSTRTDETHQGHQVLNGHVQGTVNGQCESSSGTAGSDRPGPVDFYAGTGSSPNVVQTLGDGLTATFT